MTPSGQRLSLEVAGKTYDIDLPLAGGFQASNALVAAGLCLAAGEGVDTVLAALEHGPSDASEAARLIRDQAAQLGRRRGHPLRGI